MRNFSDSAVNPNTGRPLIGAQIRVLDHGTGDLSSIFSDENGTVLANPLTVNGNDSSAPGYFEFYAEDGFYDLEYIYGGSIIFTRRNVDVSADVTHGEVAAPTFAASIGSTGPSNVQTDLNARPTSAALAASGGSAGIGFIQSGTGAEQATVQEELRLRPASPEQFGATGDGVADDTGALEAAFAAKSYVRLSPGKVYAIDEATLSASNRVLEIPAGATVMLTNGASKGLHITGSNNQVVLNGRIEGVDDAFDGSVPSAAPTKANIFIEGDYCSVTGAGTIFNIPRIGVCFNNCIPGIVSGIRFIGNFPYATSGISTHSLTGQIGVYWNPAASGGTTSAEGNAILQVSGCRFETCIQGIQCATWEGGRVRLQSTGNTFNQCWDHGIYIILGNACTSTGDLFYNCALPLVFDQIVGGTVIGLLAYSDETTRINADQGIEFRDCEDIVMDGFTIKGRAASIHCVSLLSGASSKLNRIKIRNGLITRTGVGVWSAAPKFAILFNSAEQCEDCEIDGVTITGTGYPSAETPVAMWMAGSNRGKRNAIRNVKLCYGDALANQTVFAIWPDNQDDFTAEGNEVYFTSDGTGSNAVSGFNVSDTNGVFRNNTVKYLSGGANIEGRGFTIGGTYTSLDIVGNAIDLQEAATQQIFAVNAGTPRVRANLINGDELRGTVTIANGSDDGTDSNDCARASFSRVIGLVPQSAAAAALAASVGVFAAVTNGTVTVTTGDGSNAPADCLFAYMLD